MFAISSENYLFFAWRNFPIWRFDEPWKILNPQRTVLRHEIALIFRRVWRLCWCYFGRRKCENVSCVEGVTILLGNKTLNVKFFTGVFINTPSVSDIWLRWSNMWRSEEQQFPAEKLHFSSETDRMKKNSEKWLKLDPWENSRKTLNVVRHQRWRGWKFSFFHPHTLQESSALRRKLSGWENSISSKWTHTP